MTGLLSVEANATTLPEPVGVVMVPLAIPFVTVTSMFHPLLVNVNRFVVVSNVPVRLIVVVLAPTNFAVPVALAITKLPLLVLAVTCPDRGALHREDRQPSLRHFRDGSVADARFVLHNVAGGGLVIGSTVVVIAAYATTR